MMKKIIVVLLALVLCTSICSAAGINTNEQEILDALNTAHMTADSQSVTIPSKYINMVENEFEVLDVTDEQKSILMEQIDAAWELIEGANYVSRTEFATSDLVYDLVDLMQIAADEFSYVITYDSSDISFTITRPDGTVVGENGEIIKQTGIDNVNLYIVACVCGVLFLGCVGYAFSRKAKEK